MKQICLRNVNFYAEVGSRTLTSDGEIVYSLAALRPAMPVPTMVILKGIFGW